MTRSRRHDRDTPYCHWLRSNADLDSTHGYDREDIDIVWFNYLRGYIMLIEEKSKATMPTIAEKDTHAILHQALRYACENIEFKRYFEGRPKKLIYFGYHLVQFENFSPTDGWIKIDRAKVTETQLTLFHKFAFFPVKTKLVKRAIQLANERG